MNQCGKADDEAVARAQAQLLGSRRLSRRDLVSAYRVVRTAAPGAYAEEFVAALISLGYHSADEQEEGMAIWAEAVEVAREAARADPRHAKLLVDALGPYRRGLASAGRRADALEACREMALAGERAYESGAVASPYHGSRSLACMLAENGDHAAASALFEAMVRDNERARGAGKDSWTTIAWVAETEAAGDHVAARGALRVLMIRTGYAPSRRLARTRSSSGNCCC
jgi:hypothetical protein